MIVMLKLALKPLTNGNKKKYTNDLILLKITKKQKCKQIKKNNNNKNLNYVTFEHLLIRCKLLNINREVKQIFFF